MTPPAAEPQQALTALIDGLVSYLVGCQESTGQYAGSFYSELAYHIPPLDYRAGGSHHGRTVGSAAPAFVKLADRYPQHDLPSRARKAFSWVLTRQHDDGGVFEITNRDKPSQFHLPHERSSISPGIVCHGLYHAMALGLPAAEQCDPDKGLCRLFDFPVGQERTICGVPVRSEAFCECAYRQADLLDCLVDVPRLLG